MIDKLRKSLNKITILSTIAIILAYLILFFLKENPVEKFKDNAIYLTVTSLAFVNSVFMLLIVAFKEDEWFGELKDYRLNLALGCFIAAIFSAIDVVSKFHELFKPV